MIFFLFEKTGKHNSLYQIMSGDVDIEKCIYDTKIDKLKIIPSNMDLSGVEVELVYMEKREFVLKKYLEKIKDSYDYTKKYKEYINKNYNLPK